MSVHSRLRTTAAIVALAAGTAGARAMILRPSPSGLVIITLDTTRADRLPAYGFGSVATPAIDALVSRGAVFDEAVSVAPLTLPAHTSLFTGLYPANHGVRENGSRPLDRSHATLAGVLHDRGFHTAAFVGSIVLAADRGLSAGFDVYDDGGERGAPAPHRRDGGEVVDRARAWIGGLDGKPFFLWVHLYDVHAPQALPMEFRRASGDRYEGGIAYVDAQIGRLLDALGRRRLSSKTVIVVAGDHGESLGEHGENEHGIFLYESTLRVPLVVCVPGVAARRVAAVTSLVDVFPTVLQLLGIAPSVPHDGVSLVPALTGGRLPNRAIYAESMYAARFGWGPLRMIRDREFKFIDAPRPELYDLEADPVEGQNLADAHSAIAAALKRELLAMDVDVSVRGDAARLPPDRLQALQALGYVGR
jgi:arylsulfatase A-like enzyme